jgi:DNA-binding NarL/FixJ family response regulator
MIRIAVIDDHPALRAGLHTVLETEPGLVFVGESSGDEESVWPLLRRTKPDLVLLDYHLPHSDGLQLCHRIKQQMVAPRVLVYSAYASPALALAAALARADGLMDKGSGARELFDAIRLVHRGETLLPPISRAVREETFQRIDPADQVLVSMVLEGSSDADTAQVLRMEQREVRQAVQRILSELRVEVPAAG